MTGIISSRTPEGVPNRCVTLLPEAGSWWGRILILPGNMAGSESCPTPKEAPTMDNEIFRRRRLPHWDVPGAAYFVTTCLEGSIPAQGLLEIAQLRADFRRPVKPVHITEAAWQVYCWKQTFVQVENLLDARPARRELENPVLARIIVDGMLHFATERYDLLAFVVMPSHIHWLFQPLASWVETLNTVERTPRERIT